MCKRKKGRVGMSILELKGLFCFLSHLIICFHQSSILLLPLLSFYHSFIATIISFSHYSTSNKLCTIFISTHHAKTFLFSFHFLRFNLLSSYVAMIHLVEFSLITIHTSSCQFSAMDGTLHPLLIQDKPT